LSATTDGSGNFSLYFTCPAPGTLMYVTASGGHVGSGAANPAIQLSSALGACGTLPSTIVVNELTSTAAAYALSGFAPAAGTAAVTFQGNSPGIDQAFVTLTNLINGGTGALAISNRVANPAVIQQRLNTVADAMAACDISASPGACTELFSCARAGAAYAATGQPCTGGTSTATADTLSAALSIVQNAGQVSMAGIYDVATSGSPPFTPALAAAPAEWTLPLVFSVPNYGPLAIDAGGHVWLLAPDPHPADPLQPNLAVTEIDADGKFLSPHQTGHDWNGGGVSTIPGNDITNLAIDQSGSVWVRGTGANVAKLNSDGSGAVGFPVPAGPNPADTAAVAIDSGGDAWITFGDTESSVFELAPSGTIKSGSGGYSTSNCPCNGLAADALGNMWTISNGPFQFLSRISSTGSESSIFPPPNFGGNDGGLAQFYSVAADGGGHLWIADKHYHGVWEFTPSGATGTYSAAPYANNASPGTIPKGIAIDGAGHKWVANNASFPSITELSADGTVNLSPVNGFGFQVNSGVMGAYGVAIDGSGNVWVTDPASSVTEFVGAAAPTKNPIASAITSGSFMP
jgi:hypothetical protein